MEDHERDLQINKINIWNDHGPSRQESIVRSLQHFARVIKQYNESKFFGLLKPLSILKLKNITTMNNGFWEMLKFTFNIYICVISIRKFIHEIVPRLQNGSFIDLFLFKLSL